MKRDDALIVGGIALAGYLLYRLWNSAGAAVSAATQPLANFYVWLTSQGLPVPQGVVVFPDYSTIPTSQLSGLSLKWYGNALTFIYNGQVWQLQSHDSNGNYPAVPYVGA